MTLHDQLHALRDQKFGDAFPKIVALLAGKVMMVPVHHSSGGEDGSVSLMVGKDGAGNTWLYVYTSHDTLHAAELDAGHAHIPFEQALDIASNGSFGGIVVDMIDGTPAAMVPAEYFENARGILENQPDGTAST